MLELPFYIYRHIRLDTNEVFYIGKGNNLDNRRKPFDRAYECKKRSKYWNRIVEKNKGVFDVEVIFEATTESEINAKEIEFISIYGRKNLGKGTLCNLTDGADGSTGIVVSKETRLKLSASFSGENHPNFGKKLSAETCLKKSISLKNSPHNLRGKKLPEWWKDKIRQTKFGANNPMYGKVSAVAKSVINVVSGEIFISIKSAAASIKKSDKFLYQNLDGHNKKNRTPFLYLSKYQEIGKENALKLVNQAPIELKNSQRLIIDITTGDEYIGLESCLHLTPYCKGHLNNMLLGKQRNKTQLKYG